MPAMPQKPFVATLDLQLSEKMQEDLRSQGFTFTTPPHTLWSAKKNGVSCTLYLSGKLVVQGKDMASFIEFYLEPEILGSFTHSHPESLLDTTPRIGSDESGKGDFFGPLCVAGVYASHEQVSALSKIGVCDSKALNDRVIYQIAPKIEAACTHHTLTIMPQRYNELYSSFNNLNLLLAWGHATVIENLTATTGCTNAIVDQFAYTHVLENALHRKKLIINLTQRPRAEEDTVVAAASILARYAFLKGLATLSKRYNIELPKGAAPIVTAIGRKFISMHSLDALPSIAKMHFKTVATLS